MSKPLEHRLVAPLVDALRPVWNQLGALPDLEIARRVGLPSRDVTRVRELACILPTEVDLPRFVKETSRLRSHTEVFAELSDREIARRYIVRVSAVCLFRAMCRLPDSAAGDDRTTRRPRRFRPWMRLVGLVKDTEIARRARCAYSAVHVLRAQHLGLTPVAVGWADLPPWTAAKPESPADLERVLREAAARPELALVKAGDPRFALWFRSVGSDAADLAEAVAGYAELDVRPVARKVYQLRAVLARFDACASMSLDDEMCSLAESIVSRERAAAVLARFGLGGEPPRHLAPIAGTLDVTRERFRQIALVFERALDGQRPWLPAFDRFLAAIDGRPADGAALTEAARAHGAGGTWPAEVVESAARLLGRSVAFVRESTLEDRHPGAGAVARALANGERGPLTVDDALEALGRDGVPATPELVCSVVEEHPEAEWLVGGPPDGWFWFPERAGVLANVLRKLVSVGPVAVAEAAEGAAIRSWTRWRRRAVPPEVVAVAAARMPGLVVHDGVIDGDPPPEHAQLNASERVAFAVFEAGGPVQAFLDLQAACVSAGLHAGSSGVLGFSPLLRRIGRGRYALRPWIRGRPGWRELPALAELALAVARGLEADRVGIRVAQGTWSTADVGEDVAGEMEALAQGAEAVAFARRAVIDGAAGVYVVTERAGESLEAWARDGGELQLGPVEPLDEPIWFASR